MRNPFVLIFVFLLGMGGGFFMAPEKHGDADGQERSHNLGSGLTSPLLECENNGSFARQKYIPFEREVISRIENEVEKTHSGTEVSVYFRNLNNGPWFGIRENERFIPASLMKVTLMISYLKWAEEDPKILDTKITIPETPELNQEIAPEKKLETGKEYPIRDLLYSMIAYSDNTASKTLFASIPKERQNQTFIDLGIPTPGQDPNYSLSVKEYASFFRVLYNSSYLSRATSEMALKLLSESRFLDGIRKGVPENIPIAHKFGERELQEKDGRIRNQLHDCGIIYMETYPYLLCVMTRGEESLDSLAQIIQSTSQIVYTEIDKRFGKGNK